MRIGRRAFVGSVAALPFAGAGCRQPETPLAHLRGQAWVHGIYEHYAGGYLAIQHGAESESHRVYGVLAQKGVTALDGLQSREVPFFIRVDEGAHGFEVERNVPERLTFGADMNEADREAATEAWNRAREHIHTDYDEIRRLNWSLTRLLQQLQRIRAAIEDGRLEQFRLARRIGALSEGELPFELPERVTAGDYERVLLMLVDRLDDDRARLAVVEASIAAVGLTVRATDAGSASLAANIRKVLVAVVRDAEASAPRPARYPGSKEAQDGLVAKGRARYEQIRRSPEYEQWLKQEKARAWQQLGVLFSVIDQLTGLQASAAYRQVLDLWSGGADYLGYLKVIVSLAPGGSELSKALGQAVEVTGAVRRAGAKLGASASGEQIAASTREAGLVNTASRFARSRLDRQLAYYRTKPEVDEAVEALRGTRLMSQPLPEIPR